jgi:hypothetical protein
MLISFSLTALYAQTGKDTATICYTQGELIKIANKLVFAQEADSLYKVAQKQIQHLTDQSYALYMTIGAKQKEVDAQKSVVVVKDEIISGKDLEIVGLRDVIKKDARKLRWTRIGWLSTTGLLTYLIISK